MKTLKTRLTNLLTFNRNAITSVGTEADSPNNRTHISTDGTRATQLESQKAANDKDNRPDWFQAIHGTEYYKD